MTLKNGNALQRKLSYVNFCGKLTNDEFKAMFWFSAFAETRKEGA